MGLISFEATKSVFYITDGYNSLSITIPGHWNSESVERTIDELNKLIELRFEKDIDLHVEQIRKKGLILMNDYFLSSLSTLKKEILDEFKKAKYNSLEDMVYRFQLTYDEI